MTDLHMALLQSKKIIMSFDIFSKYGHSMFKKGQVDKNDSTQLSISSLRKTKSNSSPHCPIQYAVIILQIKRWCLKLIFTGNGMMPHDPEKTLIAQNATGQKLFWIFIWLFVQMPSKQVCIVDCDADVVSPFRMTAHINFSAHPKEKHKEAFAKTVILSNFWQPCSIIKRF